MRDNVEDITKSNLANLSSDRLSKEIAFYEKYQESPHATAETTIILEALKLESLMRKKKFECESLGANGFCLNETVGSMLGKKPCSKLSGAMCLQEQVKFMLDDI